MPSSTPPDLFGHSAIGFEEQKPSDQQQQRPVSHPRSRLRNTTTSAVPRSAPSTTANAPVTPITPGRRKSANQ